MSRPTSRSYRDEELIVGVETSAGAGTFRADETLKVISITRGCDSRQPSAVLEMCLGIMGPDDPGGRWDDAIAWIEDERRVRIWYERDGEDDVVLFDGYAAAHDLGWGSAGKRTWQRVQIVCLSHLERWAMDAYAHLVGRIMPKVRGGTEDPVEVTSLPVWFNADGKANRSKDPIEGDLDAHAFTYDGDPDGKHWTVAQAMRHLIAFYKPPGTSISAGNIETITEEFYEQAEITSPAADPLENAMRTRCPAMLVDGANSIEALLVIAQSAGLHIAETIVDGQPALDVWAARDGGPRTSSALPQHPAWPIKLQPQGATSEGMSGAQQLAENEVAAGQIVADSSARVNRVKIFGAPKRWEVTLDLVPGWRPLTPPDDVALGDQAEAKALATLPGGNETTAWFGKYAKRGASFLAKRSDNKGLNADVGRLWVLNEAGELTTATHGRTTGAWTAYGPFDFGTVVVPAGTNFDVQRRRVLHPCLTRRDSGDSIGVIVEFSFDGGTTWFRSDTPIRVLEDQCGIYLEADIITQVVKPGAAATTNNLWYALVDGQARVRVTAVVEGDLRITAVSGDTVGGLDRSSVIINGARFAWYSNQAGNSAFKASATMERDDANAMERYADRLLAAWSAKKIAGSPVIPWIDSSWKVGDLVSGISARGPNFEADADGRNPEVIGIEYSAWPPGTTLILDDRRTRA